MNPQWHSFLQSAEAVFTQESTELESFGDATGELLAARDKTVIVPLTHLALLEADGEDAKAFLHGQLTSDINHLTQGKVQHSAWCTAKGRMQASFVIWREQNSYQLCFARDLQEAIQKRLQMFILRAKVKLLSHSDAKVLLGLAGAQAQEALADAGLPCPAEPLSSAQDGAITVVRTDATRFLLIVPASDAPALWQKLTVKAKPAGLKAWRWLDIQAGFPLITAATREEFVPQMADFEKMGGVSFHKGCYPGQEIVARTQYLGKVKRHLYRLQSAQPMQAGGELHSPEHPEQASGKIVSVAPSPAGGFEALAVVQSNFAGNLHLDTAQGSAVQAVAVNAE